jgi:ABC-type dipeptide/oligopeptide/nickel transport system permease component
MIPVRYLMRRLAAFVPVLFAVTFVVFLMLHLVPGDPARMLAGPGVPTEDVERLRQQLGLDRPVLVQYAEWMGRLATGDFGRSIASRQPVLPQLLDRFSNSIQLAAAGLAIAVIIGIPLGVLAARWPNSPLDWALVGLSSIGISVPVFWVGIMLMLVFAVRLQWLPATGRESPASIILPAMTIALYSMAYIVRTTRASMLDAIRKPHITVTRSRGIPERRIFFAHALRGAMIPIATIATIQLGYLMGGAVLTETVFAWPGLGTWLVEGIFRRDFAVVQAAILVISISLLTLNLVADILYLYLDPRLRHP